MGLNEGSRGGEIWGEDLDEPGLPGGPSHHHRRVKVREGDMAEAEAGVSWGQEPPDAGEGKETDSPPKEHSSAGSWF